MENRKSGFKIGMDDTGDSFVQSGRQSFSPARDSVRIKKLTRRITFITVVLSVIFAAAFFAMYMDMRSRFNAIETAGFNDINQVVTSLDKKVAGLSEQYDKMEKMLKDKDEPLNEAFLVFEKTSASLKKKITGINDKLILLEKFKADKVSVDKIEKDMATLKETSLKDLEQKVKELTDGIGPLKESVEKLQADVLAQDEKFKNDISAIMESQDTAFENIKLLAKDLKQLKSDIVDEFSGAMDKKSLNKILDARDRKYKNEMNTLLKSLSQKDAVITGLKRKIMRLEKRIKSLERSRNSAPPKPGTIIEQDIE